MKFKKLLLGVFVFATMLIACSLYAGAQKYGDYEYRVESGDVIISRYTGKAVNLKVPSEINGMPVCGFDIGVFYNCTTLKTVTLPDSIYYTNCFTFQDCTSLQKVTFGANVRSIGTKPFANCVALKEINVPKSNECFSSQDGVLYNKNKTELLCWPASNKATNPQIPVSVRTIAYSAFSDNEVIKSISIPKNVKEIGIDAFYGCSSLETVSLPQGLKKIGISAFEGCSSLKNITIPGNVKEIGDSVFYGCKSLKKVKLSVGITEIPGHMFQYCESLTSVDIPDSVTRIGDCAFYQCASLKNIALPDKLSYMGGHAFYQSGLESIRIPNKIKKINTSTFEYCLELKSVVLPVNLTEIGDRAFGDCSAISSLSIPQKVSKIGASAFEYCYSIKNLILPNSVTFIGNSAFSGTSLSTVIIPASVGKIGIYAFDYESTIKCYSGTAGETFAKNNGYSCQIITAKKPTSVSGFKVKSSASTNITLKWNQNTSASGYEIEQYKNGKWVNIARITGNSTIAYTVKELKPATPGYKFRMRAVNADVYGNYTSVVSANTELPAIKGAKLTGRAADALRINWAKNTSADGYIVEMYQGNKWVRVGKITNNSTTTFRKSGLKASTVYKFRVRAYKMSGKTALYSAYSATVTSRTNPSIMKGVKIGGKAKDALRVNWTKNTSAQGYIVEMYKGGKWVRVAKITNGNTTTYRKAGLAKNTTYKFRVKAYYMSGKTALYGNYGSVSGKTAAK